MGTRFTSGRVGDDSPFETKAETAVIQAAKIPPGPADIVPVEKAQVLRLDVQKLSSNDLVSYRGAIDEHLEELSLIKHKVDREIIRRLEITGARSLPHPDYEKIELKDEYTDYAYDVASLKEAYDILREAGKDEDAAKILKHKKEEVTVIPEHWEHGNPRSITAAIERYGKASLIGETLQKGMFREHVGTRLVVKRKQAQ